MSFADKLNFLAAFVMRTFSAETHGHCLVVSASYWSGQERVTYDGQVMSEKRSLLFMTPHVFTVVEAGTEVVYEVNLISGLFSIGYVIRRNGIAVAVSS